MGGSTEQKIRVDEIDLESGHVGSLKYLLQHVHFTLTNLKTS